MVWSAPSGRGVVVIVGLLDGVAVVRVSRLPRWVVWLVWFFNGLVYFFFVCFSVGVDGVTNGREWCYGLYAVHFHYHGAGFESNFYVGGIIYVSYGHEACCVSGNGYHGVVYFYRLWDNGHVDNFSELEGRSSRD